MPNTDTFNNNHQGNWQNSLKSHDSQWCYDFAFSSFTSVDDILKSHYCEIGISNWLREFWFDFGLSLCHFSDYVGCDLDNGNMGIVNVNSRIKTCWYGYFLHSIREVWVVNAFIYTTKKPSKIFVPSICVFWFDHFLNAWFILSRISTVVVVVVVVGSVTVWWL